jgi:hypothetical protein
MAMAAANISNSIRNALASISTRMAMLSVIRVNDSVPDKDKRASFLHTY